MRERKGNNSNNATVKGNEAVKKQVAKKTLKKGEKGETVAHK